MRRFVGLDLDNTVIDYDDLIREVASSLVGDSYKNKREFRDAIREKYSDTEWNRVQGAVYGSGIMGARLSNGFEEFLDKSLSAEIPLCIISHKTQYAKVDPTRTDLRVAAMDFLKAKKVVGKSIKERDVYFEDNLDKKIERIALVECSHFVDDLEEVLGHPWFPKRTIRLLYSPHPHPYVKSVQICPNWDEVYRRIS